MKQLLAFVRKEFYHVFRDKRTLLILFGLPVVQILIFGFALTNEVKKSKVIIVDQAKDLASQKIITKIGTSEYFEIQNTALNRQQIENQFKIIAYAKNQLQACCLPDCADTLYANISVFYN